MLRTIGTREWTTKNQAKYFFPSITETEPLSTALHSRKSLLSELLYMENTGSVCDWCRCRWSHRRGCHNHRIQYEQLQDGCERNEAGKMVRSEPCPAWRRVHRTKTTVLSTFIMSVSHTYFDFNIGDYVFCDIPTVQNGFISLLPWHWRHRGLVVDSSSIEAIEPEWTEHTVGDNDSLVGVYPITVDGLKMPRSLPVIYVRRKGNGRPLHLTMEIRQWG